MLVVDDEDSVRRFVVHILSAAGYHVAEAANGVDALKLFEVAPFDALVTDVIMPGMTGDELARHLRQQEPSVKVLYLTGYSDRLFQEKPSFWVDEAYLEKPFSGRGLREALSLLIVGRITKDAAADSVDSN